MIKSNIKTTVKGQWRVDVLRKALVKYKNSYVSIGVHEDAGKYSKGDASVVEVALWQEFGTRTIPQRSYIRTAMDENMSQINNMRLKMVDHIIFDAWPVEQALEFMGEYIKNLIVNKIKSNIPPPYGTGLKPNPSEVISQRQAEKQKQVGHSQTLRESELLLRSIAWKVHLD